MDGVGVLAFAVHETVDWQGVESSESKGMAVDDQEGRLRVVRHHVSLAGTPDTVAGRPGPINRRAMSSPSAVPNDAERTVSSDASLSDAAVELFRRRGVGALAEKMGIVIDEMSAERAVGRMPVEGNTQPVGILHGGAHVVLAETLGSVAANVHAGAGRLAMGIELNASHSRSAATGWVTGTCTALHLGSTLTTHQVVMTDDRGRLLSTVRITNFLTDARD